MWKALLALVLVCVRSVASDLVHHLRTDFNPQTTERHDSDAWFRLIDQYRKLPRPSGDRGRTWWTEPSINDIADYYGCQKYECALNKGNESPPVRPFDVPDPFDAWLASPSATDVAVCMAGQVRAQKHPFVTDNWLLAMKNIAPDVFMVTSTEESKTTYHSVGRAEMQYILHVVKPVYARIATDAELDAERRCIHPGGSNLFCRWNACLDAIKSAERARGRPYKYVYRVRPDIVHGCVIPPPSKWLDPGGEWSFVHRDFVALSTRAAAEMVLNGTDCGRRDGKMPEHVYCMDHDLQSAGMKVFDIEHGFGIDVYRACDRNPLQCTKSSLLKLYDLPGCLEFPKGEPGRSF